MYAKVYNQIYDSSLAENYLTRLVFMDMLILADKSGSVDMTQEAIARRTNVPLEIVRSAIAELCQPDPRSRTAAHEGRRLVLIDDHRDWGWRIVNHRAYRNMRDEEARREYMRDLMRKRRAKSENVSPPLAPVSHPLAPVSKRKPQLAHAHAHAHVHEEGGKAPPPPSQCSQYIQFLEKHGIHWTPKMARHLDRAFAGGMKAELPISKKIIPGPTEKPWELAARLEKAWVAWCEVVKDTVSRGQAENPRFVHDAERFGAPADLLKL